MYLDLDLECSLKGVVEDIDTFSRLLKFQQTCLWKGKEKRKNIFFLGCYENFRPKGIRLPDFQEFSLDLKNFPGLSSTF